MNRIIQLALSTAAAASLTCGGDPTPPVQVRTTIEWTFDSYPALGITEGDNCTDLGIETVDVQLTGPSTQSLSAGCTDRQVVFLSLPPGTYTAALSPHDVDGKLLVKAPTTMQVTAADSDSTTTINVPWDAWTTAYTGSFYFKLTWSGMDCTTAMPVVATQIVTLSEGGTPITLKNDTGHKVDGTDPEPCRGGSQAVELVAKVPFGPATIKIDGEDASGVVMYTKQYDTFVGAGLSNPTDVYDVPGPPDAMPPDAGIDADMDAGT